MAVNNVAGHPEQGHVYVRDRDNRRVQQFDADGNFVRAWGWDVVQTGGAGDSADGSFEICAAASQCRPGASGTGNGQFATSTVLATGIAVEPSTGDVFVADPGSNVQIGEARTGRRVLQFRPTGAFVRAIGGPNSSAFDNNSGQPRHVTVGGDGVVYAGTVGTQVSRVTRYDSVAGEFMSPILDDAVGGPLLGGSFNLGNLELDPMTDRLLVLKNPPTDGADTVVQELDVSVEPPVEVDRHMEGSGEFGVNGLGVRGPMERLYVSSNHRILILDSDGSQPPPVASIEPVLEASAHGATFTGLVDPNGPTGFDTRYRFEYSKDGVGWTPAGPFANAGDGSGDVAVEQAASGLEANTHYLVRLVAERAFSAGRAVSAEWPFRTDAVAPEVQTGPVQHRTVDSAQLLGRINPNNLSTTYFFEYGFDESYGSRVPVPAADAGDTGVEKLVVQRLDGLLAGETYHYRLVATNAQGTTFGADRTFSTREGVSGPAGGRAYEMVTPADKSDRRGGDLKEGGFAASNPGLAAPNGESILLGLATGILDPEAGTAFPHAHDALIARRSAGGWARESVHNIASQGGAATGTWKIQGIAADLSVSAWAHNAFMFESRSRQSTKRFDGGGVDGSGWFDWISAGDFPSTSAAQTFADAHNFATPDRALIADGGQWMARWGDYRGLLGPSDLSSSQTSGQAAYWQAPAGSGARHLINECTGTVADGDATAVPSRESDSSTFPLPLEDDTVAGRPCEAGSVVSSRGAIVGGPDLAAGAVSVDGRRVFFTAPDPDLGGAQPQCRSLDFSTGEAFFGASTDCPPQLYVRQYDAAGDATVRWVSRPAAGASLPAAAVREVRYEGASADGRVVYFRTAMPLTADDPNGGSSTASPSSWDLYRYELPGGPDEDPAGGTLTRITGGPAGTADPNTNDGSSQQGGAAARFVSDEGDRVYFVTRGPIGGADNSVPADGTTGPGGSPTDTSARNLYLYDHAKPDPERWKFIARLPVRGDSTGEAIDDCATRNARSGSVVTAATNGDLRRGMSCVRASADGGVLVFETLGQATGDDSDQASDVYHYDADADELTRVSAPPPGAQAYGCPSKQGGQTATVECNADLGSVVRHMGASLDRVGLRGSYGMNMSESGSLFFESRVPLVAEDSGSGMDVYEWRGGELRLVSPGAAGHDAFYSGNSADGRDVFFQTTQRIDAHRELEDHDVDVYDARVGGGLPAPPAPPVLCDVLAGGCQGAGAGAPVAVRVVSGDVGGGGSNATPAPRARLRVAGPGRKARRRAARTGVVRLRVRSERAGRLVAVARARMRVRRGRVITRRVARTRTRMREPGVRVVQMRLNRVAVRHLARGRVVRVRVVVRQAGAARARTVSFGLRRPR